MVSESTLKDLESYVNKVFPELVDVYQKHSGTSLETPKIMVKDSFGCIQDCMRLDLENSKDAEFKRKVIQILESEQPKQGKDLEEKKRLLEIIATKVIVGEEEFKKLKSARKENEFAETLRNTPNYEQLMAWIGLSCNVESKIPGIFNRELDAADYIMFVKPELNMQTLYILKWKDKMTEGGKPTDAAKMFLIHECCHLLNQQLGNMTSLRLDESLKIEDKLVYKFLDEGAAEFLALEIFNHIYDNPKFVSQAIKSKKLVSIAYGLSNTLIKIIYKEKDLINPHKLRLQNYNFFKKINKKYGLKEVFKIIQNSQSITTEEIQKPRLYPQKNFGVDK